MVTFDGHASHLMFSKPLTAGCYGPQWSPNSRYLEFGAAGPNSTYSLQNLWVWDSATATARTLVRGATGCGTLPTWARNSERLATAIGPFNSQTFPVRNPPAETVSVNGGPVVHLGRGFPRTRSPDDRFIGFDHVWTCGTQCSARHDVEPSKGGPKIELDANMALGSRGLWAAEAHGYAYDRWLLNPNGRIVRRLVGPRFTVDSWSPDGRSLVAQWVTTGPRIDLALVSSRTGRRTNVYSSSPVEDCMACIEQEYRLIWDQTSKAFVMLTPPLVVSATVTRHPRLYVYTVGKSSGPGSLSKPLTMPSAYAYVVGWAQTDRAVVVHSGRTLLLYDLNTRRVRTLAAGLGAFEFTGFGSSQESDVALRPGT